MPGHYHQAGTGTQNQDNIMGDRPSVRISDTAYKHNHGNAMSDLMGSPATLPGPMFDTSPAQVAAHHAPEARQGVALLAAQTAVAVLRGAECITTTNSGGSAG